MGYLVAVRLIREYSVDPIPMISMDSDKTDVIADTIQIQSVNDKIIKTWLLTVA